MTNATANATESNAIETTVSPAAIAHLAGMQGTEFAITRSKHSISINLELIPPHILAQAAVHGIGQKIGDAAASALAIAFDEAKPDHGLKGKSLTTARKEWAEFPTNQELIREAAKTLLDEQLAKLVAGDWNTRGGPALALSADEETLVRRFDGWLKIDNSSPESIAAAKRLKEDFPTKDTTASERTLGKLSLAKEYSDAMKAAFLSLYG